MSLKLGLQLFTVRNYLRDDLEAGLKKFGDMGFKNVEFPSFDPEALSGEKPRIRNVTSQEMNEMMERLGMHMISFSVPMPNDVEETLNSNFNWDAAAKYAQEIGCAGPSISMMFFKDRKEVLKFANYCNEAAKICKKYGVKFIYHNHFQEFQKFDGEYVLDIFLANTDPEWVKIELDTFWVKRGGVDPVAYLDNRCILIHQKDLSRDCTNVDLLAGYEGYIGHEKFSEAKHDEFIEVGQGVLDIPGIINKAREIGSVQYLIIEQDYSKLDPVTSAKASYDYIKKFF